MPLHWCIYYGDGTTFSDSDGTWAKAPSDNVQVLLWWTREGPTILHGISEPYRLPGRKLVKHGRTITTLAYGRILERAYSDREKLRANHV